MWCAKYRRKVSINNVDKEVADEFKAEIINWNPHFQALYSHVAQQTLTVVAEFFQSFLSLMKAWLTDTTQSKPKLPNYRKRGLNLVTYPRGDVKLKDGQLRFPLGGKVKAWFGEGWQASGRQRGLYRTAQNLCINADCNGAANILTKRAGFPTLYRVGMDSATGFVEHSGLEQLG